MTTEHRAWDGVPRSDITEQSPPQVLPGKGPGPVAGRPNMAHVSVLWPASVAGHPKCHSSLS